MVSRVDFKQVSRCTGKLNIIAGTLSLCMYHTGPSRPEEAWHKQSVYLVFPESGAIVSVVTGVQAGMLVLETLQVGDIFLLYSFTQEESRCIVVVKIKVHLSNYIPVQRKRLGSRSVQADGAQCVL